MFLGENRSENEGDDRFAVQVVLQKHCQLGVSEADKFRMIVLEVDEHFFQAQQHQIDLPLLLAQFLVAVLLVPVFRARQVNKSQSRPLDVWYYYLEHADRPARVVVLLGAVDLPSITPL